jgi:mycothiol system anti-sigma-R factor
MLMADCERMLAEMDLFLSRELLDQSRENVQLHLAGCPDCHRAFDFHAELRAVVAHRAKETVLPVSLQQRLAETFSLDAPRVFGKVSPFDHPRPFSLG